MHTILFPASTTWQQFCRIRRNVRIVCDRDTFIDAFFDHKCPRLSSGGEAMSLAILKNDSPSDIYASPASAPTRSVIYKAIHDNQ